MSEGNTNEIYFSDVIGMCQLRYTIILVSEFALILIATVHLVYKLKSILEMKNYYIIFILIGYYLVRIIL